MKVRFELARAGAQLKTPVDVVRPVLTMQLVQATSPRKHYCNLNLGQVYWSQHRHKEIPHPDTCQTGNGMLGHSTLLSS